MKTATVHVDQQSIYHHQKQTGQVTWYIESLSEVAESHIINGMFLYGPEDQRSATFAKMMRHRGFKNVPVACYHSEEHHKQRCNTTTAVAVGMMQSKADVIVIFTENEALNPALKALREAGKFVILFTTTKREILCRHADLVLQPHTEDQKYRRKSWLVTK